MKKENLERLLFAMIKNSKRSDRDLAKNLHISQPTITRLRKILEKEAIFQYTAIPRPAYLGFDIVAFTFTRAKDYIQPFWESKSEWLRSKPSVICATTGQGMDADATIVTVHRDYADFTRFYHELRTVCGEYCEEFRTFIISLSGSEQVKNFTYNYLEKAYEKENL